MLFNLKQASIAFEYILKKAKSSGKIVIFVSFSIDSICALRILIHLLSITHIQYQIIPVFNNKSLLEKIESLKPSNKLSNNSNIGVITFINCGGSVDLTNIWTKEYEIYLFLLDIQRPVNHNNIHESTYVIMFDDEYYNFENCPTQEIIDEIKRIDNNNPNNNQDIYKKSINDNDSFNECSSDDNSDVLSNSIENSHETNSLSKNDNNNDSLDLNEIEEVEKVDDNHSNTKQLSKKKKMLTYNQKKKQMKKKKKEIERQQYIIKKNKIKNYYSGNFFGLPSTYILYKISVELNRENTKILWLSILAMTDHYLSCHLSVDQYNFLYNEVSNEANRLNNNYNLNQKPEKITIKVNINNYKELDPKTNNDLNDNLSINKGDNTKEIDITPDTENRKPNCIFKDTECRLFLYKHWNLYDSFLYSEYTVSNLQTWKEQGKVEINKILAMIGIPLIEAKIKYCTMRYQYKSLFKKKLPEITNSFMKDFLYNSFIYQFDEITQISATDFTHCLNSLLVNPFSEDYIDTDEVKTVNINSKTNGIPSKDVIVIESNKESHDISDNDNNNSYINHHINNFWLVYNFLSLKSTKLMSNAIENAINLQKAVVSVSTSVVDRKLISPSNSFRYAIIGDISDQMKYFYNPLSLEKFALFVLNVYDKYRSINNQHERKPLILGILNTVKNNYMVAGVNLKYKDFYSNNDNDLEIVEEEKNLLPFRFQFAAEKLNANLYVSSFNDSIVEINKEDMLGFLDILIGDD